MKRESIFPEDQTLFETYSQGLWINLGMSMDNVGEFPPHFYLPDIHRIILTHLLPSNELDLVDIIVRELEGMSAEEAQSPGGLMACQHDFKRPSENASPEIVDRWRNDARLMLAGLLACDAMVRMAVASNGGDTFNLGMGQRSVLRNAPSAGSA